MEERIISLLLDLWRENNEWYENARQCEHKDAAIEHRAVAFGIGIARDIIEANLCPDHFEEVERK